MKKYLLLFAHCLILVQISQSCRSTAQNYGPAVPANGELLFQSGFEDECRVIPYGNANHKIIGKDSKLTGKNDWVADLDSVNRYKSIYLNYTGGDPTKRIAKIIPEPGNPSNKVLLFWLNDSWLASENQQKARVQLDFYNIATPYREFYQSVRVLLHDDFNTLTSFPREINWLTISEFWNNEWWDAKEKNGFRITLGMGKPAGETTGLNFILNAEDAGQKEVWRGENNRIKVPIGKWFTMDYYLKEGDKNTGRFWMSIIPDGEQRQVVFDITNYTHNTSDPAPNGFSGYNPLKLYTSKELVAYMKSKQKTMQVYWDDFSIWKNKRPD